MANAPIREIVKTSNGYAVQFRMVIHRLVDTVHFREDERALAFQVAYDGRNCIVINNTGEEL